MDKDSDVASSIAAAPQSTVSKATNKTSGGHVNKHCGVCDKKISGANWNKHVKLHPDITPVLFTKCIGASCQLC